MVQGLGLQKSSIIRGTHLLRLPCSKFSGRDVQFQNRESECSGWKNEALDCLGVEGSARFGEDRALYFREGEM